MSFIDEVRAERQCLAQVLEKHPGIRRLVEDLYPDRAHFIFELLQNAEDTGASEATFTLTQNSLILEHDGRPFTENDILAITDIGENNKSEDDKIGRFGVGFKAVFAYSETPHIWSPSYSFAISDLVLPTAIPSKPELDKNTRFEFPFNNSKKTATSAYTEIKAGLEGLTETILLFLSNLRSIRWQIGELSGEVSREEHSETHIQVTRKTDGSKAARSHFLRFSKPVDGLEKQRVSIAFALDFLPKIMAFDPKQAFAKQLKIVPAKPGRVAVFFPAEKEASGLRFHLHAPFVPELSRASVKDTPTNEPLFSQLAALAAFSLHHIRQLKVLTTEFLGVLPNPQDDISERYAPIRKAILEEMNNEKLTPTQTKSHAPGKELLQARASLKDLLTRDYLEFLIDYEDSPRQWAASAPQKNSFADRFLLGLAITEWDIPQFVEMVKEKTSVELPWKQPDDAFMNWLAAKSLKWHQQFYALLRSDLHPDSSDSYQRENKIAALKLLKIVRLTTGSYSVATECFFPTDRDTNDDSLPHVESGVFSSGNSKTQRQEAKKLLEDLGVREIGEKEQVEAILKRRYTLEAEIPKKRTYFKDLKRFIALVQRDEENAKLFADFYIFMLVCNDWGTSDLVFLDAPFLDTGLSAYYRLLGCDAQRYALSEDYLQATITLEAMVKFAKAVGAQTGLELRKVRCQDNPQWDYLRQVHGERATSPDNQDWIIPELTMLLKKPSIELSRLVWKTMRSIRDRKEYLCAIYQMNRARGYHEADSQLVHVLRKCAWIPQRNGTFVLPSEADQALLPEGFLFDAGDEWLKKIQFGEQTVQRAEETRKRGAVAKELGFADQKALEDAQRFAALPAEKRKHILEQNDQKLASELLEHQHKQPQRRQKEQPPSWHDVLKASHVNGKSKLDEDYQSSPEPQPIQNLEKRSTRESQELDEKMFAQQNLWPNSGSGRWPSV